MRATWRSATSATSSVFVLEVLAAATASSWTKISQVFLEDDRFLIQIGRDCLSAPGSSTNRCIRSRAIVLLVNNPSVFAWPTNQSSAPVDGGGLARSRT